jgi:hypothetical protein
MDEVFIEVKFAHRHDSPGCLEMKNLKVELKERSVKLIGYCVLGDVPIKMDFDFPSWCYWVRSYAAFDLYSYLDRSIWSKKI